MEKIRLQDPLTDRAVIGASDLHSLGLAGQAAGFSGAAVQANCSYFGLKAMQCADL